MSLVKKVAITVVSAILFYLAMLWIFKNPVLCLIILGSITLHEMGHAVALWAFGHRNMNMVFIPFLGAGVSMDEEKIDGMTQLQNAVVALAGPVCNVVLIVVGGLLYLNDIWSPHAMALMSMNASLAIFNLIPIWKLDGGRFTKALFHSTNEHQDEMISFVLGTCAMIIGLSLVFFVGRLNLFYVLIYFGIRNEANSDDPMGHFSDTAMTWDQSKVMLGIYVVLLFSTWMLNYFLPGFITLY